MPWRLVFRRCLFPDGEIERFLNYSDSWVPIREHDRQMNANVVKRWLKESIPKHMFPFAAMPHGAYLILEYSETAKPSVVMWNGDLAPEFRTVAASFSDFVALLSSEPYDE